MPGKLPFMQFYPGDWLRDPAVRAASSGARGLWFDILCLMWDRTPRGYLQLQEGVPLTEVLLARMTGNTEEEIVSWLEELEQLGVFSRTNSGVIFSRRMARDEAKRTKCSEAGKKGGGNPTFKGHPKGHSKGDDKGAPKVDAKVTSKVLPNLEFRSQSSEVREVNTHPSDACPETKLLSSSGPAPPAEQSLLDFPCDGTPGVWSLTATQVAEWSKLFPSLDVLAECRKALAWVLASSDRRKTARGMRKYLVGWFGRVQDGGHGQRAGGAARPRGIGIGPGQVTDPLVDPLTGERATSYAAS